MANNISVNWKHCKAKRLKRLVWFYVWWRFLLSHFKHKRCFIKRNNKFKLKPFCFLYSWLFYRPDEWTCSKIRRLSNHTLFSVETTHLFRTWLVQWDWYIFFISLCTWIPTVSQANPGMWLRLIATYPSSYVSVWNLMSWLGTYVCVDARGFGDNSAVNE